MLSRQSFFEKIEESTAEEGEPCLREFFANIKNRLIDCDEVAIYKKPGEEDQLITDMATEEIGKFRETIQRELGSGTDSK